MPTIKYRVSSRVRAGQAEILARFYDGEFFQRAKTHIYVPVNAWNSTDERLIIPRRVTPDVVELRERQRLLDELTNTVYAAWWRDRFEATAGWLQSVIDDFNNIPKQEERTSMYIRMADLIMECAQSKDLAPSSIDQYRVLAAAFERYETTTHPLYADTFSEKDIDGFVHFLSEEKINGRNIVRSRNTITVKLKKLSAVCHYAVSRGYMTDSPLGNGRYKIQAEVYGDPVYLTIAERNSLYEFQGLPDALAVQRDIFVFQCHIGCRVSDLIELTSDNITKDGFVQYIQHKLRKSKPVVVRVPLSDTALEIIERYRDLGRKQLLPFAHTNSYNKAIHEMMRLAGLNRIVMIQDPMTLQTVPRPLYEVASSHIARRTFMANVFKATKSERITSAFTGHANGSRAFCRYTSVDDDMKLEVLQSMNERK